MSAQPSSRILSEPLRNSRIKEKVARSWRRPPIIINGAGPAGLALAQTLRAGNVPFELFERHSENSPLATKRQWRFPYSGRALHGLAVRMGFRDGKDLHATLNQGRPVTSAKQVYLKNLMTELSANINIHYGHALHHEGINIQGGAISPRYSYQNIIKRTRGSMIVGADGVFSTVRRHHTITSLIDCIANLPWLTYSASIFVPKELDAAKFWPYLDATKSAEMCRNHTRLGLEALGFNAAAQCQHYILLFSRMAQSNQEYYEHFGMWPNQRDISWTEKEFDPYIAQEIEALGPLPEPFRSAVRIAESGPVKARAALDIVSVPYDKLPRRLNVNTVSAPTVLIGDAAHKLPHVMDHGSVIQACLDGYILGENIIAAAEDDYLFSQVPENFYQACYSMWQERQRDWLKSFMAAHELDHDLQGPQDAIPRAERRGWRFLSYAPAKIDNIWVPVEGVCRRERPPVDSEDAQPQSLRHELFEKRITEQREYQDSVTAIRKKYAEGADPNAKDIEVRHTDIWSLTDEEEARVRRRYPHGPLAKREFDDKR